MKSTPLVPPGSVVARITSLHLEGNITPHSWFRYIRYPNGKPHAIDLFSDRIGGFALTEDDIAGRLRRTPGAPSASAPEGA